MAYRYSGVILWVSEDVISDLNEPHRAVGSLMTGAENIKWKINFNCTG